MYIHHKTRFFFYFKHFRLSDVANKLTCNTKEVHFREIFAHLTCFCFEAHFWVNPLNSNNIHQSHLPFIRNLCVQLCGVMWFQSHFLHTPVHTFPTMQENIFLTSHNAHFSCQWSRSHIGSLRCQTGIMRDDGNSFLSPFRNWTKRPTCMTICSFGSDSSSTVCGMRVSCTASV